jgi:hypothetical protein
MIVARAALEYLARSRDDVDLHPIVPDCQDPRRRSVYLARTFATRAGESNRPPSELTVQATISAIPITCNAGVFGSSSHPATKDAPAPPRARSC